MLLAEMLVSALLLFPQKLDVQGTILVNNEIQFINATTRIFRSSNDSRFRTGSSDRMTIDSNGRVAVGTTTPGRTFHVVSSDYSVARFRANRSTGGVALEFRNGDGNICRLKMMVTKFCVSTMLLIIDFLLLCGDL